MSQERKYTISTGASRTSLSWAKKEITWKELSSKLSNCLRTSETTSEYEAMSKEQKAVAKDCGGFVGGTLEGKQRKASAMVSRSLITLDIDYAEADTVDTLELCVQGAWCLYSTHSHTPEKPRYRLIMPLTRDVNPDEYIAIARKVADNVGIGMDQFDDSTYQPERLMFWPSCPKDGEFVFRESQGDPIDADLILSTYNNWENPEEWPASSRVMKISARSKKNQEDPTEKTGIIGAFCRTYSISEAINAFLPEIYTPCDTMPGRYTYANGSTTGGAVVYEDKWIYSHHGTDPLCEKEANAFDMVRIHLFGDLDREVSEDTPVNRLPSFSKMADIAGKDERVRLQISRESMASASEDFNEKKNTPAKKKKTTQPADDTWTAQLEWKDRKGRPRQLENTPYNFALLLENLPALKEAVVTDEFSHNRILTRDLPWRSMDKGQYWTDADDLNLIQFFSKPPYYTQGKQNIIDAARVVSGNHQMHPIKEYLESLTWDGVPRLDTLVIDYLGAQDNELNRVMTRKHFCAAVRRIYEPGCKHDGVLALDGPQGIGKSTLIRVMFGKWFSDTSISVDKANETGLALQGTWGLELAELTDYKKSTVEAYKNFISSVEDKIRIPYDRSYQTFPRQCVIFASTNDNNFLKGDTGNRRFWIIPVGDNQVKGIFRKDVFTDLPAERDQIWAEAMAKYKTESSELGALEKVLYERQSGHNEIADDIRIDKIRAYMEDTVPRDWQKMSKYDRKVWNERRLLNGLEVPDELLIPRPAVSYQEIAEECLMMKLDAYTRKTIKSLLTYIGVREEANIRDKAFGRQRRYALSE